MWKHLCLKGVFHFCSVFRRRPTHSQLCQCHVIPEKSQHTLRGLNANMDGRRKIAFAIAAIKGVGRRHAHVVLRKADIVLAKRAGELMEDEVERVMITITQNPWQYKVPDSCLIRQKDVKDRKYSQVLANGLDNKLCEDLERLKIRAPSGLRHFWGLCVWDQHTATRTCL